MAEQEDIEVEVGDQVTEDDVDADEPLRSSDINVDSPNLVYVLKRSQDGRDILRKIGAMVIDDRFDPDWRNSADYRENFTKLWHLFMGKMKPKKMAFKGAAQVNIPMLGQNIMRINTRIQREVFGDYSSVFGVKVTGDLDDVAADALTLHGNRQLRHENDSFPAEMEAAGLMFLMPGHVVGYSYYDRDARQNCHETLMPDEYAIPYTVKDRTRDFSKTPHISRIMNLYRHEMNERRGEWDDDAIKEILRTPGDFDAEPRGDHGEAVARQQGIERPTGTESDAPYMVIHHEGWDNGLLPGQTRDRYIRVYVDYDSRKVLSLNIHETAHWKDRQRYDMQVEEGRRYNEAIDVRNEIVDMTEAARRDAANAGQEFMAPPLPQAPPRPSWMDENGVGTPAPPRYVPLRMFSKISCIENIGSSFGMGFGQIQYDLNVAANMAYDAVIDAATLSNSKPRLATKDLGLDDNFVAEIGRIKMVDCSAEELQGAILSLDPGPPNQQLGEMPFRLYDLAQAAMSAPDVLSGGEGKSGETWRGQASRIEQATAQLSYFGRKFSQYVEQILYNNAKLNELYMPETEFIDFAGKTGVEVRREWYRRSYSISFTSSIDFTPRQQRIALADEVAKIVLDLPDFMSNPAIRYHVLRNLFEARDMRDLVELMGAPPPPPPQFVGVMPPAPPGAPGPPGPPPPPGAPA